MRRQNAWRPATFPFLFVLALALLVSLWAYEPDSGPLGWATTVLWSLPAFGSLVGVLGALETRRRKAARDSPSTPDRVWGETLLVAVPTIGRYDTYPALQRAVRSFCEHLPAWFARLRVDVIVEEDCEAWELIHALAATDPLIRVVVVPRAYRTRNGTRFKGRANHYANELRVAEGEAGEDVWVLHMDDDTGVGPDTARAVARFIQDQRRRGKRAKHLAQGVLAYPREHAVNTFTWLADAMRPAEDITRFAYLTGGGTPLAGLHGELMLVRASVEARIGWDFGPDALVEDSHFALTFCTAYPGRSDWFAGHSYGASPATVSDLLKQRERWAAGLLTLILDRTIPLRNRIFLGYGVGTWIIGPFQHVGFILLLGILLGQPNVSPVSPYVLPFWALNGAYVFASYWEGLRINRNASAKGRRKWWECVLVVLLVPVFSFLEGIGGFRGLVRFLRRGESSFVVIRKPS